MRILTFILTLISLNGFAQVEALEIGTKAPNFSGVDQNGNELELEKLLLEDNVLLIFYRGNWCPYCEKHLSALQDSLQMVLDKGTSVVVVTPEKSEAIQKMVGKTGATYSIVHDEDYKIMNDYKLAFKINKETVPRFYTFVLQKTRKANENEEDILPVPATYLIGKDGTIKYAHFDEDYRNRSSIKEILENL